MGAVLVIKGVGGEKGPCGGVSRTRSQAVPKLRYALHPTKKRVEGGARRYVCPTVLSQRPDRHGVSVFLVSARAGIACRACLLGTSRSRFHASWNGRGRAGSWGSSASSCGAAPGRSRDPLFRTSAPPSLVRSRRGNQGKRKGPLLRCSSNNQWAPSLLTGRLAHLLTRARCARRRRSLLFSLHSRPLRLPTSPATSLAFTALSSSLLPSSPIFFHLLHLLHHLLHLHSRASHWLPPSLLSIQVAQVASRRDLSRCSSRQPARLLVVQQTLYLLNHL